MVRSIVDPSNARSRRTREALLSSTLEVLEADGFEGLTMQAVAERAGVTRRSIYLHFGSRQELVGSVFVYVAERERLTDSLKRIWASPDAVSALAEYAEHIARYLTRVLALDRAADRVLGADPDAARFREIVEGRQVHLCRRLADRLHDEGRLAAGWSPQDAADLMWSLSAPQLLERLIVTRRWSRQRLAGHLKDVLTATLVADGRS